MIFEKMREAVKPILEEIHRQPFNQELSQGILSKEKFIHYVEQDALYLADFAKALALTASRLNNHDQALQLLQFSLDALNAERALHANYLAENFIKLSKIEPNPACFMYTNYLLKTASLAPVEEALASLLPCFWVYREVGHHILKKAQPNNPYQDWIELYSSEPFDLSVNVVINMTNDLAHTTSDVIKEKMLSAFIRSTQLEYLFWHSAYHQEKWLLST